MSITKFTARTVDHIKPTPGRRVEYFDATVPGLALRVTATGHKSWTVLYRHRGRLRRLTLGSAAVLTLSAARDRARDTFTAARDGADPATDKQHGRRAETMAELAEAYIERYAKRRKRSWKEDDRILRADVLPHWRQRAIADIRRRDVRALVDGIAERGAPIMANRVVALLSKVFKFALDEELIETSPAVRIPRPASERQRDRVLTEAELRRLWKAFEALSPEMAALYELRAITAQRGGEVASMRWRDLDLQGGWWTIPATMSKNKLAHRVPLSDVALTILKVLQLKAKADAVYVLAGARGRRQRSEAAGTLDVPDFRGHDLRRTAASMMASGGVSRLVIAKILNHVERDITAVYDRHSYDAEKRAALDWWAVKLQGILAAPPSVDSQFTKNTSQ